jgi:diadenosine tetraphosphate (Ap4A) HIT family hydrolase
MKIDKLHKYTEYSKLLSLEEKECSFCGLDQDNLTVKKFEYFVWLYSAFSYRKYHTILIPIRHIVRFSELNEQELAELGRVSFFVEERYKERGIVSGDSNFGDQLLTTFRMRTTLETEDKKRVQHLHIHFYPKHHKDPDILNLDEQAHLIDISVLK